MFDVRAALQGTVLLFVEMKFIWTISNFFKEEYEHGRGYMIPYQFILDYYRNYKQRVYNYCGHGACPNHQDCPGNKFLKYLEMMVESMRFAVGEKKVLYRHFYFENFYFTREDNKFNGQVHLKSWDCTPMNPRDLAGKTYSQRISLLN